MVRYNFIVEKSNFDYVGIVGSLGYDTIMNFPSLFIDYLQPEKLHQINVSFVVDRLEKQLGGIATNIAYNLSLVTKKKVKVFGAVGKDGNRLIRFLRKQGIDTENIFVDKKVYTASGLVITDRQDNQIWGYYYGASHRAKDIEIQPRDKNGLMIISATHLDAFIHFQKAVIKKRMSYLYDPGMVLTTIKPEHLLEGVNHCTWLVGNDYEMAMILKKINKKRTQLLKDKAIITTFGEEGVCYQDKKNHYHVGGYPLKKIVDPTGAGDAWRAGFIGSIIEGKSIVESLKQANALASFAIEKYGTVNHRPTISQINKRAKKLKFYQNYELRHKRYLACQ